MRLNTPSGAAVAAAERTLRERGGCGAVVVVGVVRSLALAKRWRPLADTEGHAPRAGARSMVAAGICCIWKRDFSRKTFAATNTMLHSSVSLILDDRLLFCWGCILSHPSLPRPLLY